MPQVLRFLRGFGNKVEFDDDFEFSPAGFRHFKGRGFDGTQRVGVSLVQLKLHFFQPVGDVLTVHSSDIDGPLMRMVGVDAGGSVVGVKGLGDAAID